MRRYKACFGGGSSIPETPPPPPPPPEPAETADSLGTPKSADSNKLLGKSSLVVPRATRQSENISGNSGLQI